MFAAGGRARRRPGRGPEVQGYREGVSDAVRGGGKKLIRVVAAVDAPPELRERVLGEGLVLAAIGDDVFELQIPDDFEPRGFPYPG